MKYLSYVLLIILYTSCKNTPAKQQGITGGNSPDTVSVFLLHDTSVGRNMDLPAELLPYEKAEITARVQGYIRDMKVDIGDKVYKGQILAIIDAPELSTHTAEFQASLDAAKSKYMGSADVYHRLYKAAQAKTAGIVAPVDLERSRNQYLADSASFESSRKLAQSYKEVAGYLNLKAPFDGVITARNADRGALVGNNQPLLTIQNNNTLRLRVAVPEIYTSTQTPTAKTDFRVDAYPEKLFQAVLSRKSESIDATTRTELWEYAYDNKKGELKAGSFAYVKLSLQRIGNSFIVTPSAIVTTQERKFVIRVKAGKAEWLDVRQGMSTDKGIEIFGNLTHIAALLLSNVKRQYFLC
jgi:membrane fusion protein (multidrug efflux system)